MRWIAGDPELGFALERARDEFIYQSADLDLDELWQTLAKQRKQKNRPGELNAKYSPGALADLEGTVQLLQVMHARKVPQLRSPRVSVAMESLRRGGVLDPAD